VWFGIENEQQQHWQSRENDGYSLYLVLNYNFGKNQKTMRQLFLFLIIFFGLTIADGQTCPTNLDFEFGSFNNWNISAFADTIIISDTTKDVCGNFPMLCPDGGRYTARIGDTLGTPLETDSQIVTYTFLITS
jgi:hypothetical protein